MALARCILSLNANHLTSLFVILYHFSFHFQNRTLERTACILFPSLYLLAAYHHRFYSHKLIWPYPIFERLVTAAHFTAFLGVIFILLVGLAVAFQHIRDRRWKDYIVPKHLQLQTAGQDE